MEACSAIVSFQEIDRNNANLAINGSVNDLDNSPLTWSEGFYAVPGIVRNVTGRFSFIFQMLFCLRDYLMVTLKVKNFRARLNTEAHTCEVTFYCTYFQIHLILGYYAENFLPNISVQFFTDANLFCPTADFHAV